MSLLKEEYCVVLCEMELNHKQVRAFSQRIDEDYTLHMRGLKITSVYTTAYIVEPLNNGHIGDECPLFRGCPFFGVINV